MPRAGGRAPTVAAESLREMSDCGKNTNVWLRKVKYWDKLEYSPDFIEKS